MDTTNITGNIITILIAIIGWIITARQTKKQIKNAQEKALQEQEQFEKRISLLTQQVDALTKQAEILEAQDNIPQWEFIQWKPKSIRYVLINHNSYTAYGVCIHDEKNKQDHHLGNMAPGSEKSFDLRAADIYGLTPEEIIIQWKKEKDATETQEITLAFPSRY